MSATCRPFDQGETRAASFLAGGIIYESQRGELTDSRTGRTNPEPRSLIQGALVGLVKPCSSRLSDKNGERQTPPAVLA